MNLNAVDWIAYVLVVIGAINWALFAFNVNLVSLLSFGLNWLEMTVYILVGLSGLWMLYLITKIIE